MSIGETIKEHPKATVGIVIVLVIVLYLLFNSGGSNSASPAASGSDVQAATNAYIAQQQANAQNVATTAGVQANQDSLAADLAKTGIVANVTNHANDLQSGISIAQINAQQQEMDLANTLTAHVQEAGINAQTAQQQINANTQIATITAVTGALVQQQQIAANAATTIAVSHDTHSGGLFGGGGFLGLGI